jgi:two-component system, chemotaxis family, chemotaxis protein CheY
LARKILLADDSVTAQNMGRKILADAGYEVITVNNGSAALKKIAELKPDLIVLDVYMPGYSGLEVCQRLKEVGETARIPVLLTVGKLEPFKTDEAKRVRADGFIVKPFEASELLSALSKLEDKIVPRAESKPGRFARATAAVEDRAVAGDEDNGWKNRISFPSKKKEPAPEADGNDPAIYNPVNKDLRTVVEHHGEPPAKAVDAEERVDVGALAPEGLPKDVTPEEIAAIAAAAAQMQGKVLEAKAAEERDSQPRATSETQESAVAAEPIADAVAPHTALAEQAAQPTQPSSATGEVVAVASESVVEQGGSFADSTHRADAPVEEPVTMAAAAGAHSSGSIARWTAVAVAVAPEESGISLEQEMQRAYAEFAAQAEPSPSASIVATEPAASATAVAEISAQSASVPALDGNEVADTSSVAEEVIPAVPQAIESPVAESAPAPSEVASSAPAPTIADESSNSAIETSAVSPASAEQPAEPESKMAAVDQDQAAAAELHTHEAEEVTAHLETSVSEELGSHTAAQSSPELPDTFSEPAAGHHERPENKDSDVSSTTAAAWASWRKIRESSTVQSERSAEALPSEKEIIDAAMAVAAGAEKSPEDVGTLESDPAIASIVDSVLANLRPKIVEEISRKLGKKT